MPNDAKLGLLLGVGTVIVVAVVFFRNEAVPAAALEALPASLNNSPASTQRELYRPVKASPTAVRPVEKEATAEVPSEPVPARTHEVQEGENLFSIAEKHLGNKDRFVELYQLNRKTLKSPDELPVGTVLTLPAAPASQPEDMP